MDRWEWFFDLVRNVVMAVICFPLRVPKLAREILNLRWVVLIGDNFEGEILSRQGSVANIFLYCICREHVPLSDTHSGSVCVLNQSRQEEP